MQQRVLTSGFICKDGKVLLLKRGENQGFLPGFWELPGGKLEFGEDPICGVLREVKEETGADCEVIRPYYCWHNVSDYKGAPTHFVEIDFILSMKAGQEVKAADGMADHSWVSKKDVDKYKMTLEMKKAIIAGFEAHG